MAENAPGVRTGNFREVGWKMGGSEASEWSMALLARLQKITARTPPGWKWVIISLPFRQL